jgi:outer membrane protein insertion porin family
MREHIHSTHRVFTTSHIGPFAIIAVLLVLICCGENQSTAQIITRNPGSAVPIIDKITIIGVKALAPSTVLVLSGARIGDASTPQNLDDIRSRLVNTGLFGLHNPDDQDEWVRLRMESEGYPYGHCELLIVVDENDKVTAANISGAGPISTDDLLPVLHIGAVYNTVEMSRARRTIQEMYASRGYAMTFGSEFGIDPQRPGILTISIVVARVRDIRLSGNHNTRAFVIRRELKTKEGAYFNRKELSEDIRHLGEIGLFSDIDPTVTPVAAGQVSVEMKVTEKKARQYNFGSTIGGGAVSGYVEVSDNNFRGQGEELGVHIEDGLGANRHAYQANFVEPYIDRHGTSMTFTAFDVRSSVFSDSLMAVSSSAEGGTYVQEKIGGSLLFKRPLNSGYFLSAGLRGETIRTEDSTLGGVNSLIVQDGPLALANFEVSHNTLDQKNNPVTGGLQKLTLDVGHADLHTAVLESEISGQHNFAKSSLELQRFINLQQPRSQLHPDTDRNTLAIRVQAGSAAGVLPFTEQYFLGGETGLRGYRDGRFWGQNMATGTLEYRHPLMRDFKGVLFADAGDAWGGNYQDVSLQGFSQTGFKVHASTGAGIRVGTPLGLVRLDYGYGDEGGRVHFGLGYSF